MMRISCLVLFVALSGWIYTGCERHELTETRVLYSHGAHGDDHHGDDHDKGHHDEKHHGGEKDHGDDKDHGHKDSEKPDQPVKEPKAGASVQKEEPRNLGI